MRRIVVVVLLLQAVGAQTSNFTLTSLLQLMTDCGTDWGCFAQGCEAGPLYRCSFIAMYREYNGVFEFVLSSKGNGYAALGLSSDRAMGGDEVLACAKLSSNGNVVADHYYNPGGHNPSMRSQAQLLTLVGSFYQSGQIGCRFTRPRQTAATDYSDLTQPFYQLYVFGPMQGDVIGSHVPAIEDPLTSTKAISISTDRSMVGIAARAAPAMLLIVAVLMALVF